MENLPSIGLNLTDPKVIETIKKTVAVGLDDIELAMFLELCKSSGLNPFKREAWAIKAGNRAQIMVGLNGYLKIANSHPQFDGMEIMLDADEKGELISATCKVHRKDRKYPSTGIAFMNEYKKNTPIWSQMPSVMLGKVAKCIAIREAFPLETAGTYAEEEMPEQFSARQPVPESVKNVVQVADEIGQGAEAQSWVYDLDELPTEHQLKAAKFLTKIGATQDQATGWWYSPKEIKNLTQYRVGE